MDTPSPKNYFAQTLLGAHHWQHRPEFDRICEWWRDGGRGVCALVGMGGVGKTAIAERFLRTLPGDLPGDPAVARDTSLSTPASLLVFSFYDAPHPESFFEALQMWLEDSARLQPPLSVTQILYLLQRIRGLIVLDGLEMVQEDGSHGVAGRLSSFELRDVLDRVASGWMSGLSILVTSRFPLVDLRDARTQFFRVITVDQVDLSQGIQLLRDRGVRGSESQLSKIVEDCGRHVLTVDVAGGFIKAFGNGDPATPLNLGAKSELPPAEEENDPEKGAVLRQGERLTRIAQRYREAMISKDEAALALLERLCLFRLGVDCETLASIFTGQATEKISGIALAKLTLSDLQKKLQWLAGIGIVEAYEDRASDGAIHTRYTIHPAVRDGFLIGFGRDTIAASHEAICMGLQRTLEGQHSALAPGKSNTSNQEPGRVRLGGRPGSQYPTDGQTLDLMEEIIHHTLEAGDVRAAWTIYQSRIGGCNNLLKDLNDYARAARTTNMILRAHRQGDRLPDQSIIFLQNDFGYSHLELGHISAATEALSSGLALCRRTKNSNVRLLAQNLAGAHCEAGRLRSAIATLQNLLPELRTAKHVISTMMQIAEIQLLRGTTQLTINESSIESITGKHVPDDIRTSLPITLKSDLLDPNAHLDECRQRVEKLVEQHPQGHARLAEARLDLAERLLFHGDEEAASLAVQAAREWSLAHDARGLLCRCALMRARIDLAAVNPGAAHFRNSGSRLFAAENSIAEGMLIARDCGYGIHHINLLLARARLHLCEGRANEALNDVERGLDKGVQADEESGQPALVAANDEECGYAWAIPAGLQLRAEALLLQSANEIISLGWTVSNDDGLLDPIDVEAAGKVHPTISQLVSLAKQSLDEALDHWHDLRDPEPTEDSNFVDRETGKAYNYEAKETHQVLQDLGAGRLTRYPVTLNGRAPANLPCDADRKEAVSSTTERVASYSTLEGEGIPCAGQNNLWYHFNESDTVFVFVHGVLSDSRCWLYQTERHEMYWPALIKSDQRFGDPSFFLGGYYTAIDAGPYEVRNCADEFFGALQRIDKDGRPPVMKKHKIVFVCHSMGGIVVRYMLESNWKAFAEKEVGVVLIASPSYGSTYANDLTLFLRVFKHHVGSQLKWGNWSLRDLDDRFKALISRQDIPKLCGVELYENHCIVPGWLSWLRWKWVPFRTRRVIVTKESAGRYFGAPLLMRNTDHFSIVKPTSKDHPTHQALLDFVSSNNLVSCASSTNPL